MKTSEKFKIILMNMEQEKLLDFIWMYDQYVSGINCIKDDEEDWNISPLNIEDFYSMMYKKI